MVRAIRWMAVVLGLLVLLAGCSLRNDATSSSRPTARPQATQQSQRTQRPAATATTRPQPTARPRATATARPRQQPTESSVALIDGFRTLPVSALPPEARDTLQLIEQGGPFPYRQDGAVFQNRERILPRKSQGYYREYTVETPGSDDRGARRIVTGDGGEIFYTADHYDSFVQVVP